MIGAQVVLLLAVVWLWLQARPVADVVRVRAKAASQLSEQEWARMWLDHGRVVAARDRARRRDRRTWLKGLARHLTVCEVRWRHEGWTRPAVRVLAFHRRYAETHR